MVAKNLAFLDGQNLYLGTKQNNLDVDLHKFRVYLKDKYSISKAYYFLGYINSNNQDLYTKIQNAGFIIIFKEHNSKLLGQKKGNVDTDIVFEIMKQLIDNSNFSKIVLVSGDGDYKKLVDYLITKNRFKKVLFPNKQFASSLYKKLGSEYFDYLENIKKYIS